MIEGPFIQAAAVASIYPSDTGRIRRWLIGGNFCAVRARARNRQGEQPERRFWTHEDPNVQLSRGESTS